MPDENNSTENNSENLGLSSEQRELTVLKAMLSSGIDPDVAMNLAPRVLGDTAEELEADAKALFDLWSRANASRQNQEDSEQDQDGTEEIPPTPLPGTYDPSQGRGNGTFVTSPSQGFQDVVRSQLGF